eukprot:CAMPEP_0119108450 /NCGR_PEP_ID=MMETSP1180-20130426/14446_1 /TAXON_ID=3052 ORGANISM="Chlamydomonas cf sp, Strain CCMP681" /NCGR_SAMPLE_ID=MMETSP1180 /ASSEMBLY_ACC=CAM_ASM_000741 /LENGTH=251 /DNA_ID=CAMNT_0007094061 /DNA_START=898 /DNA_END=1650 /DNA_ORIENTATION=-
MYTLGAHHTKTQSHVTGPTSASRVLHHCSGAWSPAHHLKGVRKQHFTCSAQVGTVALAPSREGGRPFQTRLAKALPLQTGAGTGTGMGTAGLRDSAWVWVMMATHQGLSKMAGGGKDLFSTRGITLGPLFSCAIMCWPVCDIRMCYTAYQGVIGIAVSQQGADGQQHLGHGERRAPLVFEDVQADGPAAVDVAVVDARAKGHLWWLERVVCRKGDVQEKDTASVRAALWTNDGGHPFIDVVAFGARTAVAW